MIQNKMSHNRIYIANFGQLQKRYFAAHPDDRTKIAAAKVKQNAAAVILQQQKLEKAKAEQEKKKADRDKKIEANKQRRLAAEEAARKLREANAKGINLYKYI